MPEPAQPPAPPRLLLDVSSLARWTGPPVGMIRVEQAVAFALADAPGAQPVVFDPDAGGFRLLRPAVAARLTGLGAALDPEWGRLRGWQRLRPRRHQLFMALEAWRLRTGSARLAARLDRAQRWLCRIRPVPFALEDAAGVRLALLPAGRALGPLARLGPADILFSAASGWVHLDMAALARAKAKQGFRLAVVCYDLLPLTRPEFFPPEAQAQFGRFWRAMLPLADTVIVNSQHVAGDVQRLAAGLAAAPRVVVVPLGCDAPGTATLPLRHGLQPGRFALYVSTLEPRKNHAMLLRVWQRLRARGLPQRAGYRLVCVGRAGWWVEALLAGIAAAGEDVLHLAGIADAELETLYAAAGCCLYPSVTEGFGLPVVEAMARGQPVLVSTGGSLPEAAGGLGEAIDPADEAGWEAALARMITDRAARDAAAARVRAGFRHRGWEQVAREMLAAARAAPPGMGGA